MKSIMRFFYNLKLEIHGQTNTDKALELIKKGANPNYKDVYGRASLWYQTEYENIENMKKLLELGANPNIGDNYIKTPLYLAIQKNNKECIRLLLDYGADPNQEFFYIFATSYSKDKMNIARILLEYGSGIDINFKIGGNTILLNVVSYYFWNKYIHYENYLECIKFLLENGSDPNIQNYFGSTPLMISASYGDINAVKIFLKTKTKYKLDLNITNNKGYDALLNASRHDKIKIAKLLIKYGHLCKSYKKINYVSIYGTKYNNLIKALKIILLLNEYL